MANKLLQTMDLRYMRSQVQTALPDTINILRKSVTSDQQGGFTEAWSDAYQNIPARLATASGGESISAGQQDPSPTMTLTESSDQSVEQTDRVVHASGTYEVQFIDAGKSWDLTTRCQIRRI